ncbi:MAG: two-component system, OmpR family, sensor kinase [Acidimicrobiaceae bacterium]|jgi:signal transduction histidine kinase|nr:two-component system, OmpR family, sensor kinase [Acidimicrobiaceae bacterium]
MSERFSVVTGAVGELFFNVSEAIVIARPGQIVAWSPSAERVLGLSADDATHPGTDLMPVFGDGLVVLWHLVEAGGQSVIDCTNGCERVFEATAWRLAGQDDPPTVVVMHDVTDDRRHAKGLKTLNGLARELLAESSLDVLLTRIVDAAKDLTRADFSALITVHDNGPEIDHFVYNAPRDLFPARLPRVVGLLAVPVKTKTVARINDIRGHPAGVGIPVEHPPIAALLAAPILVDDQVVGELAVANGPERQPFDEIDEAMLTELAAHGAIAVSLVKARESQQEAAAARRALMDTALHNIRTPLTVAKGFMATLHQHYDALSATERTEAFAAVDRAHDRIQRLAEGALLDEPMGVSPAGKPAVIDVAGLGRAISEDTMGLAADVTLQWMCEDDAPPSFRSDPQLVRELLDNLVSNAVKHAPPTSEVIVTVRREGDSVRFDVSDRGQGIPAEEQARVFEQFYRTRQSVAAGVPGTGLGLWIVRRLSDLLGGTVGLSSRPGEGTTFWVTFPCEPALRS